MKSDAGPLWRRSVNEREAPSFRKGSGASGFDSNDARGFSSAREESKDFLEGGRETDVPSSTFCAGPSASAPSSIAKFLCLRAGQTYSMIRLPTLASTCKRMGCKLNSKLS
jgi:hypothetical protein